MTLRRKKWISSYLFQLIQASRSKSSLSLACTTSSTTLDDGLRTTYGTSDPAYGVRVPHRSFCKSFCICRALCIPESLYSSSFTIKQLRTKGRFNIYINLFQNRKCSINGRNNNYCYWWLSFCVEKILASKSYKQPSSSDSQRRSIFWKFLYVTVLIQLAHTIPVMWVQGVLKMLVSQQLWQKWETMQHEDSVKYNTVEIAAVPC